MREKAERLKPRMGAGGRWKVEFSRSPNLWTLRHETAVEIGDFSGLHGQRSFRCHAGMGGGTFRFRRGGLFRLPDHGGGQLGGVAGWDQMP